MKNQLKQANFKIQVNKIETGEDVLELVLYERIVTFELLHKTVGQTCAVTAISPDGVEFSGERTFTVYTGSRWVPYILTSAITQDGAALNLSIFIEEARR